MQINVSSVIESKNPKLNKLLPKFVIRFIEKIIHQDEINYILDKFGNKSSVDFASEVIKYLNVSITTINEQNIPRTGRFIMASNHPLGGLDGLVLITTCGQYHKEIKLPVNDILYYIEPMREIFIPINKHGKTDNSAFELFNKSFESDALILYFPAGLCSRKQHGIIKDLEWKKTIISKAIEYQRDIIPVYFKGQNSNLFYNLANLRKKLGIKSNLEMTLLPHEMFRQKNASFSIIFGEAIPYQTFDKTKNNKEWANWLKEKIYQLK